MGGARRAHDDLAGADAHARLHGLAPLAEALPVSTQVLPQLQRRVKRLLWMVLARQRRPEHSKDTVVGYPGHMAVVAQDGVAEQPERRLGEPEHLLRIAFVLLVDPTP